MCGVMESVYTQFNGTFFLYLQIDRRRASVDGCDADRVKLNGLLFT